MGTRHLTAVFLDGKYRVAQYGQWDGYPEEAGQNCLNFARTIVDKSARDKFADKVRKCAWATNKYIDNKCNYENWQKDYPEFSRDTGSNILQIINDSNRKIKLTNVIDFVADGFMCEWVWVIDLDNNTFEGFKGFNSQPLTKDDRFKFLESDDKEEFYPAKLVAKWKLDNLPTNEEFLASFKEEN